MEIKVRERVRLQLNTFPVAYIPALPATTRRSRRRLQLEHSKGKMEPSGSTKKIQGINPGLVLLVPGEGLEPTHLLR